MRRRFVLSIAVLAVLALAGAACGKSSTTTSGPSATGGASGASPAFTTLKSGMLQVASCLDFDPFESVKAGKPVGFDVELVEEIARRLGLQVQWVKTDFESSFTA